MGLLGQLMVAAPTVRDMFAVADEYRELHVRHVAVAFEETVAGGRIGLTYPASFTGSNVQFTQFFMAALVTRIRSACGSCWTPRLVEFDHRPPVDTSRYVSVLGPRLKFGRATNALSVDRATLGQKLPPVDPDLYAVLRELGDRLKSEAVPVHDIGTQVHREISTRLATGGPFDLECIAATLGLSARALQYRLDLAGTSYEATLIETRRRLAERYLRDTDLAITEISARLGFSELSAFTRAAQRWFDMPPRTYRNHMRGPSAPATIRAPVANRYSPQLTASSPPARGGSARRNRAGSGSPGPRSSRG
jgi:AraC-like DNA-binding protein